MKKCANSNAFFCVLNSNPNQTRLYIVDCFWLEGIKVLFRFSLAELCVDQQLFERLRNCEHAKIGELINEIKFNCNRDHDLLRLTERAFRRTRMPSRKQLVTRRNLYSNQLIAARHARNARHHDNSSGSDESFGQNSITSAGGDSKHIEPNIIYNASLPTTPTSIDGSSHRDRSSSRSPISISPATPPGWLRKSVQDLFRLSTPQSVQSNGSTNTIEGDITRKSGALVVSSNHSKIALLQSYGDHSRIDVRDIRYCSIFYPNRRPSIVLSDSEQHAASVCRLDARFDARLWLVGVSSDAHHVLLCEPEAGNYACTTFLDKGVRVWLFEVPGRLQFAFFNARDWTLLTVDPMGRVSKMPLKAAEQPPDHVQQSEPFLIGNNCSSNDDDGGGGDQLLMASLDPDYRLLWLYCTAEVKMNDINPEIAEDNSQIKKNNEKLASLSLATVALQTSATERFGRLWMRRLVRLARKSGSIEEEERRDVNNDQSINRPDHERRKSSGIELSGSDLDDESSVSSNPGVEVKSTNLDNLHPNYSSSTESGSDSDTSIDWQILQTDSDYSINRHFTQTDGEPVVKTSTTTNPVTVRRIQRVLVLDTVNLRVFRELRLNGTVQITHLVTAGGMAYCAHADGSVSMMSSGSDGVGSSMLNSRKSLLQAQPDEKLIHLQVFDVSCPASLKSLVGEQLAECLKRKHSDSQRSTASSGSADLSVIGDADEMHSDRDMVAPEEPIDSTSRTESLEESTEMIPPLPARLSHVRNSDILVVALYRSGKLHCIYTKNGCVQERKMTRLDVSGPEGLQIERLNIVSALKMDWKEEEEAVVNNALSCRSSSLDMNASGPNEPDETDHQTEGRLKPRSASILKRSASHKLESELDTGRSIVRRCSLSPNQCSYLVTLCSPTPNYRLINVKL